LGEFTAPENYKTNDELKKRFSLVIGEVSETSNIPSATYSEPKSVKPKVEPAVSESIDSEDDDEEDDTLSYFSKLAQAED
jgi:hypothetical protein